MCQQIHFEAQDIILLFSFLLYEVDCMNENCEKIYYRFYYYLILIDLFFIFALFYFSLIFFSWTLDSYIKFKVVFKLSFSLISRIWSWKTEK